VATTRGADPWIYHLGEENVKEFQNPYYMSFERAEKQWKYDDSKREDEDNPSSEDGARKKSLRHGS
jgi:hypothetical protein